VVYTNNLAKDTVFTIGHSTRLVEDFVKLLKDHKIKSVIDIRTIPRSRRNPQFNADTLPNTLNKVGLSYQHMAGLGGFRRVRADSPNSGWRNASFRGFADYMQTPEFEENLEVLIRLAQKEVIVLMCAEAVPWRCHRSLIADALVIRGITVEHILSRTSCRTHVLTPWAHISDSKISYPYPDIPETRRER
jgi:uncharacterized protein (DUF488 family)